MISQYSQNNQHSQYTKYITLYHHASHRLLQINSPPQQNIRYIIIDYYGIMKQNLLTLQQFTGRLCTRTPNLPQDNASCEEHKLIIIYVDNALNNKNFQLNLE